MIKEIKFNNAQFEVNEDVISALRTMTYSEGWKYVIILFQKQYAMEYNKLAMCKEEDLKSIQSKLKGIEFCIDVVEKTIEEANEVIEIKEIDHNLDEGVY